MTERYPGYDVMSKRNGPSWNDKTRQVVDDRLATPRGPRFFSKTEYRTVESLADRIVPQPRRHDPIPVADLVDARLLAGGQDGFRHLGMPPPGKGWRRALAALDAEAQAAHGADFRHLSSPDRDGLLHRMHEGRLDHPAWQGMSSQLAFTQLVAKDIVFAYYAHPTAWSEIGWGGPASPRGYVRTGYDRRDPWEAAEVKDGDAAAAMRKNRRVR
ncbi:MAG: gluconate 2-dehydrogenase subunit 3 family protein [Paracoccus sp. (in: a-proteobacteria)]|uniref:gluconate 2-dehydrogenase subunit 3 family protein n=1 Tax=Paracoccus sp. TaxID=267 RepID=UPI0040592365